MRPLGCQRRTGLSQTAIQSKQSLFEAAARVGFIDPVTGEGPNCEEQLGAALSYFHQTGRIDWQAVPATSIASLQTAIPASEVISNSDVVLTPSRVVATDQDPEYATGEMLTGLLFVSRDQRRAVLLKSKIGYGVDPRNGRIDRQLSYLRTLRLPDRRFILLSTGQLLDRGWYFAELSKALRVGSLAGLIRGYIMRWEAILAAVAPAGNAAGATIQSPLIRTTSVLSRG